MRKIYLFLVLCAAQLLTAQTPAPSGCVTLLFGGDVMCHSTQFQWAYSASDGRYDFTPCFRYIQPYVAAADLSVVNVELTYGGEPYSGYPNFSAPDAMQEAIIGAGWDVMLLANNHILDKGKRGLERTLDVVGSTPSLGAYRSEEDRASRYPLIREVGGVRIALFNCTYSCNGYRPTPPNHVNMINREEILRDLESIRDSAIDLRIMTIHWGIEYALVAGEEQRRMAEWLQEQGFDLVIGGHPHVVENRDSIGSMPIYFSLGNLVSNQRKEHTDGGIMVQVQVDTLTKRIVAHDYIPYYVHRGFLTYPAATHPQHGRLLPGETAPAKMITEKQFFILPTRDYLDGHLPFQLAPEDEQRLIRCHTNITRRL